MTEGSNPIYSKDQQDRAFHEKKEMEDPKIKKIGIRDL
jgi:hypothetical protein